RQDRGREGGGARRLLSGRGARLRETREARLLLDLHPRPLIALAHLHDQSAPGRTRSADRGQEADGASRASPRGSRCPATGPVHATWCDMSLRPFLALASVPVLLFFGCESSEAPPGASSGSGASSTST